MLSEYTVSSNDDLLRILDLAGEVQRRSRLTMPLLVDENIHYRILRMLYGRPFITYAVHEHLNSMPLLFGIWHAYKHTVAVMFRAFFPLLGLLEGSGADPVPGVVRLNRKVIFLERLYAALILCTPSVMPRLEAKIQSLESLENVQRVGTSAGCRVGLVGCLCCTTHERPSL
jgi:hypothetical protein